RKRFDRYLTSTISRRMSRVYVGGGIGSLVGSEVHLGPEASRLEQAPANSASSQRSSQSSIMALPAFEWAKARAEAPRNLRNARGIRLFSSPGGDKGSALRSERRWPSSDDLDSGTHRRFFPCLNLRVEPLAGGVGDPMVEVRQDIVQVFPDHPRPLHDRWQLRMRRPEVPVPPMPQGPALTPVLPQVAQRLLDRPSPPHLH